MGREVEGRFKRKGHRYTYGWFVLIFGRPTQYCKAIILQLKVNKIKKKIPGVKGKFGLGVQHEAGQRLTEFCQENTLVIANTLFQQCKRHLCIWTSPNGQHRNQTDYILCSWKWRSSIQSSKMRPGSDCGSDHEFIIAKLWLKLKKVGTTTKPFWYDCNQIPYDYTVGYPDGF